MLKNFLLKEMTSIRNKILIPFVVILGSVSIFFIWVAVYFINGFLIEQELREGRGMNRQFLEDFSELSHSFEGAMKQLSQSSGQDISGSVNMLKNQFEYQVIWQKSKLPSYFDDSFEVLTQDLRKNKFSMDLVLESREARLPRLRWVGVASVLRKDRKRSGRSRYNLYLSKEALSFSEHALDKHLAGVFFSSETFVQEAKGEVGGSRYSMTPLFLSSEFQEDPAFLSSVLNLFPEDRLVDSFDHILRYKNNTYRVVLTTHPEYPFISIVKLVSMSEIYWATFRIVGLGIVFLIILGMLVFFVYSVVIRKITTSLEVLSRVAQKVSSGDLDQHVFVTSRDEIGALSKTFNMMISSLKTSSEKLLQEKKQNEAIMASIPEGILVTDLDHKIVVVNEAAEEFLNVSFDKVASKSLEEVVDHPELLTALTRKLQKDSGPFVEEVLIDIENGQKILSLTSCVVLGERSKPLGQAAVIRDVTHDKKLEELRDSFLRTVSHELRTPLTSIIGFIDLVKNQTIADDQKKYLQIAYDEALSLKELINNLLELSRIEAGDANVSLRMIHVVSFVSQIVASLEPLAKGSGLTLVNHIKDDSIEVFADSVKFKGIFINLISNAIKFTDSGTIELFVTERETAWEFSVKDTGIGMTDEEKEVIFEKFRQVDDSSTRRYEGIGLGLSLVKQLVVLHDGEIWVESEYGKGATFYFTISKR